MSDYYLILGVEPDAKAETIQERFRFLANAFHPDRYSSSKQKVLAEDEFKKINEAYQVLSDPHKRADYDLKRNRIFNSSRTTYKNTSAKAQEATRQRKHRETAKQEEQRKRSKQWIEANQTRQQGAILRGVDLRNGFLQDANFEDANLRDANLNGSRLYFAKLVKADLTNSKLIYAWLNSPGYGDSRAANAKKAIFRGANLKYARLGNVNFSEAILENADFTKSIMYEVNLTRANLKGAILIRSTLQRANFTNAILIGSNLNNADLEDANLTGAILDNANFEGALYTENTIWPKGFNPKGAGAILNDLYYKHTESKIAQKARAQEEEQQERDKARESKDHLQLHFPAAYYRNLKSALGPLSDFTYTTVGNKTIGVNPTECSTIELIGSEDFFTELKLNVDYVNENSFNWAGYVVRLIVLFLDQLSKEGNDWHNSQLDLDKSSYSDIHSEKRFGNCLISFRSKHSKGTREYSFKRIQEQA